MPKDDRDKKRVTVEVYVDQDEWLEQQAQKEDRSKAYVLRRAIDAFIRLVTGQDNENS